MRVAALLLLIACEKSGPVESTPGTVESVPGATATPRVNVADAGVATLPNDAANLASVPADAAPAMVDAAVARAPSDARARANVAISEDDVYRMADLLAGDMSGPSPNDMDKRRPGADLGRQLSDPDQRGRNVAVGGGGASRGTARLGAGGGTMIDSPDTTGSGSPGPTGRISVANKSSSDSTTLTVDMVLAKVMSAYMAGIKRCYKAHLRQDPNARGKVKLAFRVTETGRTVQPSAKGFAQPIDDCLTGMMASWRFPIPKGADGEATTAELAIDLNLVPD